MTYLIHYGTKRHSGRYPWGSGEDPQRSKNFKTYIDKLRKRGLSEKEIAKSMGMTTTSLRSRIQSENINLKLDAISTVQKLKEKGYSNKAIANRLRLSERTVNNYLRPEAQEKLKGMNSTVNALKDIVKSKHMVDVGPGSELQIGITSQRMKNVLQQLKQDGYVVNTIYENQLGAKNQKTPILVLAEPGTQYKDIYKNRINIKPIIEIHSSDNGKSFEYLRDVELVDPKRIAIRYAEDGGKDRDGVIELRRGVKDLDLNNKVQAQVRIAVEGDRYLKGMAYYVDDLPEGVDIRFNTNKSKIDKDGNPVDKLDVMKKFEVDMNGNVDLKNPFGTSIKAGGQRGALNIVNEELDWDKWDNKNTLSSQFLSKQSVDLAKQQLELSYKIREDDFKEIMSLTNPVIKKDLLNSFSERLDADAVDLKAAALPRQANKVILPVPDLKENEIYAPTFKNGETVVLIRHPHGGLFEIPEVVVNNKNPKAKAIIQNSVDAVGINPKVAQKLSGADFDGDTVLVIPNKKGTKQEIKTAPSIKELQDFDHIAKYGIPKDMIYDPINNPSGVKVMTKKIRDFEMGKVSNLITDMTIKGAGLNDDNDELVRAIKHSMVVIDAYKHKLNYKQSYIDNNIVELQKKYQGKAMGGASTLISRAGSEIYIPKRVDYEMRNGKAVYIDPDTGKRLSTPTNEMKTVYKRNAKGELVTKQQLVTMASVKMREVDDANKLSSGTPMENVYANYANNLKAMANQARLEMLRTPNLVYSKSANKVYSKEVKSLKDGLQKAISNKPYERQATLLSNYLYNAKKEANPNLDSDDLKKLRGQCLAIARAKVGANKKKIEITDNEWNAIQSGAISNSMLTQILANTDKDKLVKRALPKQSPIMAESKITRAKAMMANGYVLSDIAGLLGVSISSLSKALNS